MNRLSIVGDAKGKGSENGEGKGKGKGGKNANRCPVALLGGPLGPLNFSVAKNCHIKVGVGRPHVYVLMFSLLLVFGHLQVKLASLFGCKESCYINPPIFSVNSTKFAFSQKKSG